MYRAQIGARAADGVRECGSLDAYIADFRACSKAFEMYVADRLSGEKRGAFVLWEDLDASTKERRGLTKADAGVDVTDGATTLVQCKLRARYVTWRECATFFASAVSFTDGAYSVPWASLLLARNACSKLSKTLAELGASRPFDAPVPLSDFRAYAEECLTCVVGCPGPRESGHVRSQELRDYQVEAVEMCMKETAAPAYVVLPTGCGKSLVMALVAARSECRVLILVPLVVLLEQLLEVLAANGCEAVAVGGGHGGAAPGSLAPEADVARVVVCVYNSAHKVLRSKFQIVMVDEAHCIREPRIYAELRDEAEEGEAEEGDEGEAERSSVAGYAAVRAASRLPTARLFSATQDVPEGAERCERTLREMIDAGYLCDYALDVPVFDVGAGNADLARHLVRNYRSMIVFCAARAEGLAFCAAMNELGPCARYVDCETGRRERGETLAAFKSGSLAFIVNVRVLSMGFDAPIAKGVCFVHMPASKTHIVQVIGRSLRLHADKRLAHVVLPLVAGSEDEDERVRGFMRVLAQNDARLAEALRSGGGGYVSVRRVESAVCEIDQADTSEDPAEALYTAVYDAMGVAVDGSSHWDARYDELVTFYEANKRLPPANGRGLGNWVLTQRRSRDKMDAERKARLESLEWWVWNSHKGAWSKRYDELVAYHEEHKRLPLFSAPCGLGKWVDKQRQRRETMELERKVKLDSLPWWVWNPYDDSWSLNFDELVACHSEHSGLPPMRSRLGQWVNAQRAGRETMSAERRAMLESLPWWVWDVREDAWLARYDELVSFYATNGRLPATTMLGLGTWVHSQRQSRDKMDAERKARLDSLEWWVWKARATPVRSQVRPLDNTEWDARFDELVAYHTTHRSLPATRMGGLGKWVDGQRQARATMESGRRARLDNLGWWVWNAQDAAWSAKLEELIAFHAEHGMLPGKRVALSQWVYGQRRDREKMAPERKAKLEALGWWTWSARLY